MLGRIVCQLVNEACFALGEGVGAAEDIDAGMVLGLNHPRGPLEWGDAIGPATVLGVLAALCEEYREERYRAAPALLRAVRTGAALRAGRRLSVARRLQLVAVLRRVLLAALLGARSFPPARPPRRSARP